MSDERPLTDVERQTITAHVTYESDPDERLLPLLTPAAVKREWMDQTNLKYAYRCTPLVAANSLGWVYRNTGACTVRWNGDRSPTGVTVDAPGHPWVCSLFGSGVVTFHLPFLFQTPPGWGLLVSGPANAPKRGISALEGLVETDWLPFTFTMNWQITEPDRPIHFERDEVICRVLPYPLDAPQRFELAVQHISQTPDFAERYRHWRDQRNAFHERQQVDERAARSWQKDYLQGRDTLGQEYQQHQVKYTFPAPQDRRVFSGGEGAEA